MRMNAPLVLQSGQRPPTAATQVAHRQKCPQALVVRRGDAHTFLMPFARLLLLLALALLGAGAPVAPIAPPPRMTAEQFIEHTSILYVEHEQNQRLYWSKITPTNVLAVRRFLVHTKNVPGTVIAPILANPDMLLELDMGDVELSTFADAMASASDEWRRFCQRLFSLEFEP